MSKRILFLLVGLLVVAPTLAQTRDADGEERYETGEVHYHAPGDRALENVGETVAECLVVVFNQ
jgi:hypothetical protein